MPGDTAPSLSTSGREAGHDGVLRSFPSGVLHAFAYGSKVFSQPGLYPDTARSEAMTDYMFIVRDPLRWHQENIAMHPSHYGWLGKAGASWIHWNARTIGASLHFNPHVTHQGQLIKYGVIGIDDALRDLLHWNQLYLAGRMHKPVRLLTSDSAMDRAQLHNTVSAVAAALLIMPETFDHRQLLSTICGLSYQGDVRMTLAEDHRKVERIVQGSEAALSDMYSRDFVVNHFATTGLEWPSSGDVIQQPKTPHAKYHLVSKLPTTVLYNAARTFSLATEKLRQEAEGLPLEGAGSSSSVMDLASRRSIAEALTQQKPAVEDWLPRIVQRIVQRSSKRQAVAGFLASGPLLSLRYILSKVAKRLRL